MASKPVWAYVYEVCNSQVQARLNMAGNTESAMDPH